jgi:sulfite exporter TauE/SafE
MSEHLAMLAAWCGPGGPGLVLGLLRAGLAGGPLHCWPMCGPFVLGQAADRMASIPAARLCALSRLRSGLLLPYHAGRLLTYAGLGAVAGALGALPGLGRLAAAMLLAGALLLLLHAARSLLPGLPLLSAAPGALPRPVAAWLRRKRLRAPDGFLLGLALGFLPCGLLYAALAVAAGSGGAMRGGLAMLAFGLGTVPTLAMVGIAGHFAPRLLRGRLAALAPVLLLANAALLAAAAAGAVVK